jgi:hypothetical protein
MHFLNKAVESLEAGGDWASEQVRGGLQAGLNEIIGLMQGTSGN